MCVCVFVRVHGHSRLLTLLVSEGWDWEAETNFTQSFILPCCLARFREHRILGRTNKTKWEGHGLTA